MTDADETPAMIRRDAVTLTGRALQEQIRAVIVSGEWRELGYRSAQAYVDDVRPQGVRYELPERREQVAELSAAGVKVADQAAILGVSEATVKVDRTELKVAKPRTHDQEKQPDIEPELATWAEDDIDAAAPDVTPTDVEQILDEDPSIHDAQYVAEFSKALRKLGEPLTFDPDRLGPLITDDHVEILAGLARSIPDFARRVKTARRSIRIVNGGKSS